MSALARQERQSLCGTLIRVGPDAPTLCGDWTTAELAAHLVVRESRPLDAAGIVLKSLADRTDAAVRALARSTPWPQLVEQVRQGPPRWNPTRWSPLAESVNLLEFVVHHEDVLRAGESPSDRLASDELQAAVWTHLIGRATMLLRNAPTGVVLVTGHARKAVRSPSALGTVVVRGRPIELALYCHGRQDVAEVSLDGSPEAVAALRSTDLSL